MRTRLGIIGGTGVGAVEGLTDQRSISVETVWGKPSDEIIAGRIDNLEMFFLPRHGRGHFLLPSKVPYRANIAALKSLGVSDIISVSACGSFREDLSPGTMVIVDQIIDRTHKRNNTYFGNGCVGHVSMAKPTCGRLSAILGRVADDLGIGSVSGGTYLAMEGPQFSSLAESLIYKNSLDCSVIGMTAMPEAKLAREAEICYATLAMVTDYDCWHPEHGEVSIPEILKILKGNSDAAGSVLSALPALIGGKRTACDHGCDRALEFAVVTAPEARDPALVEKLRTIAGRVL